MAADDIIDNPLSFLYSNKALLKNPHAVVHMKLLSIFVPQPGMTMKSGWKRNVFL
jgi:hypothetical protein